MQLFSRNNVIRKCISITCRICQMFGDRWESGMKNLMLRIKFETYHSHVYGDGDTLNNALYHVFFFLGFSGCKEYEGVDWIVTWLRVDDGLKTTDTQVCLSLLLIVEQFGQTREANPVTVSSPRRRYERKKNHNRHLYSKEEGVSWWKNLWIV